MTWSVAEVSLFLQHRMCILPVLLSLLRGPIFCVKFRLMYHHTCNILGLGLWRLITPGLNKDFRCHVWPYFSKLAKYQIRHQAYVCVFFVYCMVFAIAFVASVNVMIRPWGKISNHVEDRQVTSRSAWCICSWSLSYIILRERKMVHILVWKQKLNAATYPNSMLGIICRLFQETTYTCVINNIDICAKSCWYTFIWSSVFLSCIYEAESPFASR